VQIVIFCEYHRLKVMRLTTNNIKVQVWGEKTHLKLIAFKCQFDPFGCWFNKSTSPVLQNKNFAKEINLEEKKCVIVLENAEAYHFFGNCPINWQVTGAR
jgi:hypothetical protein